MSIFVVEPPSVRSSFQGSLLIAMPALQDPYFHRTVTLMVSHDENGAFGVVLGPLINLLASEVGEPFGLHWERADIAHVRYGGPCERSRIWLLHGGKEPMEGAVTITPGVHLGSSPGLLQQINEHPEVPATIFSGYASWAPGQLEREVQEKSWLPGEVTPALVFNIAPDDVWEQALRLSELSPGLISSGLGASA